LELIDYYGELCDIQSQIVYKLFLLNYDMDKKEKNELNEQVETENGEISCSSCPFDVMTEKIMGLFRRK